MKFHQLLSCDLFTTRSSSCGKVMFHSRLSVSFFIRGGKETCSQVPSRCMPGSRSLLWVEHTSWKVHPQKVQPLEGTSPLLVTKVSGTNPTGMHTCYYLYLLGVVLTLLASNQKILRLNPHIIVIKKNPWDLGKLRYPYTNIHKLLLFQMLLLFSSVKWYRKPW